MAAVVPVVGVVILVYLLGSVLGGKTGRLEQAAMVTPPEMPVLELAAGTKFMVVVTGE